MGYCLGGTLAFLLSARSDVDLVVGYDCAGLEPFLDDLYDIRVPTLFHLGERDVFVSEALRKKMVKKLASNTVISLQLYPEAGHAFLDKKSGGYHAESAALAAQRTREFLVDRLKI